MRNKRKTYGNRTMIFFMTVLLMFSIFLIVGISANAKQKEQPLYKYYQSYLVKKDDTLLSIARCMNDDICTSSQIQECVNEMIALNSLDHKGTICYGNYIIVPYYSTEYR